MARRDATWVGDASKDQAVVRPDGHGAGPEACAYPNEASALPQRVRDSPEVGSPQADSQEAVPTLEHRQETSWAVDNQGGQQPWLPPAGSEAEGLSAVAGRPNAAQPLLSVSTYPGG